MAEPIRILEIVNVMDRAGLETMLMNHYSHLDRDLIQLDFLTHRPCEGAYDQEIMDLGGRIFRAPRLYPQNFLAYRRYMRSFFDRHYYPVVHSHIDAMSAFPLAMAKSCAVPVRIAHSHNDSVDRDLKYPIKEAARRRLPEVATHYWACSEAAGEFLFGKSNCSKLHIVKNAIDLSGFSYDIDARIAKRAELGISDNQLVVGHVGRFSAVKNQSFVIDVLSSLLAQGQDAVAVFVGVGELHQKVEEKAIKAGFSDRVRFLGLRDDVAQLMQSFDVLCFPSLHEGIPLTLIEAQSSGLPILTSENVSTEALVLPNCVRLSLGMPIESWSSKIIGLFHGGRAQGCFDALSKAGYEIKASAQSLQDCYLHLYEGAVSR